MSKAVLIVICDFLILSLLALARFDVVDTAGQPDQAPSAGEGSGRSQDLVNVFKVALESERQSRERLQAQLAQTEDALGRQQGELLSREQALEGYRASLDQSRASLEQTRASLERTERAANTLERDRSQLQRQIATTQTNLALAQNQLTLARSKVESSEEKLGALETELARQRRESEQMNQQLSEIEKKRAALEADRQKLAGQLQLSETEKRLVREQLESARSEIAAARVDKARLQEQAARLAEGVSALAEKSDEIKQEIRENRPIAANTLFNDFISNRVDALLSAERSGIFGQDVVRRKESKSVILRDGTNHFALFHVEDTPFQFWPRTDWERFSGSLQRANAAVPVTELRFLERDPRIVVAPLRPDQVRELGAPVYPLAPDPFKFGDAVLVGASEGYYGECKFQLDPELPDYVRMQRGLFSRLVGNYSPSRGDLVLSRTGELLGVMVNKEYCGLLKDFTASAVLGAENLSDQNTRQLLSRLHDRITRLPNKLQ